MGQPLHILLIEDSPEDAELLSLEIKRGGYEPIIRRVTSAKEMGAALARGSWDIVISDYVVPGFGGPEALALLQASRLDLPFIIVSGHIGEELAVGAMKAGAQDYLMKDRLGRLAPTIARELHEAETRRAHKRALDALYRSEERFRQLAENIGAAFFMFEVPQPDSPGVVSYVSPAYEKIWGYPCESLYWEPRAWLEAIHPDDRPRLSASLPRMARGRWSAEFRIRRMDLGIRWVEFRTFPVMDESGKVYRVAALAEDISERKRAEEQLATNAREMQSALERLRVIEGELRRSNEELSHAGAELEQRVQKRTADLAATNSELECQISERKRLEAELLEIAENERREIGFDLHDDVGQKLMGVSLLVKALERNLAHKHLAEASDARKVLTLINEVISYTHNLARCFSSLDPKATELCALFKRLAGNVRRDFRITCRVQVPDPLGPISSDVVLQLYKIAQEAVSNAIKHGKAKLVVFSLDQRQGNLTLRIRSDGIAFAVVPEAADGMGLRIMKYRAHTIGGALDVRADGNSGTVVTCRVPNVCGNCPVMQPTLLPFEKGKRNRPLAIPLVGAS